MFRILTLPSHHRRRTTAKPMHENSLGSSSSTLNKAKGDITDPPRWALLHIAKRLVSIESRRQMLMVSSDRNGGCCSDDDLTSSIRNGRWGRSENEQMGKSSQCKQQRSARFNECIPKCVKQPHGELKSLKPIKKVKMPRKDSLRCSSLFYSQFKDPEGDRGEIKGGKISIMEASSANGETTEEETIIAR